MSVLIGIVFYWLLMATGTTVGYFWAYWVSHLSLFRRAASVVGLLTIVALAAALLSPVWALLWLVGILVGFFVFGLMDAASRADAHIDGGYDGW
jgi:hypothetical protein